MNTLADNSDLSSICANAVRTSGLVTKFLVLSSSFLNFCASPSQYRNKPAGEENTYLEMFMNLSTQV